MLDTIITAENLTIADMREAHDRIRPHINRTPVLRSDYLDDLTGAQLFSNVKIFRRPAPLRCAEPAMLCLD